MTHHIIFEGAELSGKSWIMSQIYDFLESKYHESDSLLDGCYWFNCDVGVFGTDKGKAVIKNYVSIFKTLQEKNIIVEKFHLADKIYSRLYRQKRVGYRLLEKRLQKLNFKIVLVVFPEDENIIRQRLEDRIKLYPHYRRIAKEPSFYIAQQKLYLKKIKRSKLPYLIIEADELPSEKYREDILDWLGEE